MIKKCCENCMYDKNKKSFFTTCEEDDVTYCYHFMPKEELVRTDEKHKFITLLKSDLENYKGLAIEKADNNHCKVSLEYNEVRKYIKSTIELLEKN